VLAIRDSDDGVRVIRGQIDCTRHSALVFSL
jgi:hypothetical protein